MIDCSIKQIVDASIKSRSHIENPFAYVLEIARIRQASFYKMVESTLISFQDKSFQNRFTKLIKNKGEKLMTYRGKNHKENFKSAIGQNTDKIRLAAIYLLTADNVLWNYVEDAVGKYSIDFKKIKLGSINSDAYALFMTAKDICLGTRHIGFSELSDKGVIGKPVFKIILNAFTIARYGIDAINAMEREEKETVRNNKNDINDEVRMNA